MRMKGEEQGEATGASSSPAVISALDRYAGIFRGRKARLSRVRALCAPPQAPLTAAPRPQDGRRAIKDGPAFVSVISRTGQPCARTEHLSRRSMSCFTAAPKLLDRNLIHSPPTPALS